MGEKVTSFYRYIRPIRFDEKRLEFNTLPNGGICFRFDLGESYCLNFSAARCHEDDHFNKSVARRIADSRMAKLKSDERLLRASSIAYISEDTDTLVKQVIECCESWQPTASTHHLITHYMNLEWKGLADQLKRMIAQNERERQKGQVFITAAHALELASSYGAMSAAQGR